MTSELLNHTPGDDGADVVQASILVLCIYFLGLHIYWDAFRCCLTHRRHLVLDSSTIYIAYLP